MRDDSAGEGGPTARGERVIEGKATRKDTHLRTPPTVPCCFHWQARPFPFPLPLGPCLLPFPFASSLAAGDWYPISRQQKGPEGKNPLARCGRITTSRGVIILVWQRLTIVVGDGYPAARAG